MSIEQQYSQLTEQIQHWAAELGFQQVGISSVDLGDHPQYLDRWLAAGYHGEMGYMSKHGSRRSHPEELIPGTLRVLSLRMDYLSDDTHPLLVLDNPRQAYISRYTLGREYQKLVRKRLAKLAQRIEAESGGNHRAFVDSAPVLERAIAEQAGLGWIAKNAMLINPKAGSWFFLGEIYTDLPLPTSTAQTEKHCGTCTACLDICPTQAFVGAGQLDARRCISYLTIEHAGSIDESLRPLMGNRIFGCDDCQLVCPWNKFAETTKEKDFSPRHELQNAELIPLFQWDEATWLKKTEGSAIRRIGYQRWLRNLAIALGNAPTSEDIVAALQARADDPSELVREHVHWALTQHQHNPLTAG
jgi:epoxyqueuosine reductase